MLKILKKKNSVTFMPGLKRNEKKAGASFQPLIAPSLMLRESTLA